MLRLLPGGICFAHGPYTAIIGCPKWPECEEYIIQNGPNLKWVKLAEDKRIESVKTQIKNLIDTL